MVSVQNEDRIGIVESWLSSEIDDSEVHVPNFQVCHLDRDRQGGNVLLYVKNEFLFLNSRDFNVTQTQCQLFCKITVLVPQHKQLCS